MCCNLIQKEVLLYDFVSVIDLIEVRGFHLCDCFLGLQGIEVVVFEIGMNVIASFGFIEDMVVRYDIIYDLLVLSCECYQNLYENCENYLILKQHFFVNFRGHTMNFYNHIHNYYLLQKFDSDSD